MSDWCDYRDMQDRDRGYIRELDDDLYGVMDEEDEEEDEDDDS